MSVTYTPDLLGQVIIVSGGETSIGKELTKVRNASAAFGSQTRRGRLTHPNIGLTLQERQSLHRRVHGRCCPQGRRQLAERDGQGGASLSRRLRRPLVHPNCRRRIPDVSVKALVDPEQRS